MNESKRASYEAKRAALKQQYRRKKRQILLVMLAIVLAAAVVMIAVGISVKEVRPRMISLLIGALAIILALIFGGQRIHFYTIQENTQLNLLEQEEPFGRFKC